MLKRLRKWIFNNRWEIAIVVGLFIVAAVPRMMDLGVFLTADEKNWIGRSFEFVRAFKDWRFNDMLQTTHPGVITMWLAGVSVTIKMLTSHIPFSFQNLVNFVAAAQFPIALVNSLAVPAIYLFLRKLFSRRGVSSIKYQVSGFLMPLLAAIFIALNPFIIGYSRVVHVDALLMSFTFLAALATLIYAREGYARKWLIVSAVLTGLAILTKAPGIFMLPYLILTVLVFEPQMIRNKILRRSRLRDLLLWVVIVVLMFVLMWPAMLFVPDPQGNVLLLKRDFVSATATPHHMAESYSLEAGHYAFTLLTRTSPVVLIFVIIAVLGLLAKSTKFKAQSTNKAQNSKPKDTKTYWLLVAYIFFFILMMTLGAKKGDRYILPVFPALDVLASVGVMLVAGGLTKVFESPPPLRGPAVAGRIKNYELGTIARRIIHYSLFILPVVYLAVVVTRYHPYNIAYSSPLFPDNLSQELGWGEGLEQVGAWLSETDPDAVVASWYPEELGAYTSAQVAHINAHEQGKVRYIVLYKNMFGRAPDHYANNFIDEYFMKREPVHVITVAGKEYAWVYEKWAFERIVGELVPGVRVSQKIGVIRDRLSGVDLLVATYSGKADEGNLIVQMKSGSVVLERWSVPVKDIEDDRWLNLKLSEPADVGGQDVDIEIFSEGTRVDNAPTLRYTNQQNYRSTEWHLNGDEKKGDLAIRLRYDIGGEQEATEEDTKLLE